MKADRRPSLLRASVIFAVSAPFLIAFELGLVAAVLWIMVNSIEGPNLMVAAPNLGWWITGNFAILIAGAAVAGCLYALARRKLRAPWVAAGLLLVVAGVLAAVFAIQNPFVSSAISALVLSLPIVASAALTESKWFDRLPVQTGT